MTTREGRAEARAWARGAPPRTLDLDPHQRDLLAQRFGARLDSLAVEQRRLIKLAGDLPPVGARYIKAALSNIRAAIYDIETARDAIR